MRFPIIELRDNTLYVLSEFDGLLKGSEAVVPHNRQGNRTRHIIDSAGDLKSLEYMKTDCTGFRALVSALWNISKDHYKVRTERGITVSRFRELLERYSSSSNPDCQDLAGALLEAVKDAEQDKPLSNYIANLNL